MNQRTQSPWSVSGILEAPLDQVWEVLFDTLPGLPSQVRRELERDGHPEVLTMSAGSPGEGRIHLKVDKRQYRVAIQGEWWYRGEYSLTQHPHGCLLVYQVYNIAPGTSWWLAQLFQGPQHARKMETQLQTLLRSIGEQLGCTEAVRHADSGR